MRGYIRSRGPDKWQIVCEAGCDGTGKRRQVFKTLRGTKRAAQKELAQLIATVSSNSYVHPTKATVADFLRRWLESYSRARVTALTFEKYEEIVDRHLIPAFGQVPLSRLRSEDIQYRYTRWTTEGRLDGKAGGLSRSTIAKFHAVLHKALRTAVKWRILSFNPAESVDLPRSFKRERRALTLDQSLALMRAISAPERNHVRIPIMLMLYCGLRRSEVLGLQWSDVDRARGTLHIRRAIVRIRHGKLVIKPPKNGRSRMVLLPSLIVTALIAHKAEQGRIYSLMDCPAQDQNFIVANEIGKPRDPLWLSLATRRLFRRLGLPNAGPHILRHTFTTRGAENQVNPKVLSEALGHSRVSITLDVYTHLNVEAQKVLSRVMDAELQSLSTSAFVDSSNHPDSKLAVAAEDDTTKLQALVPVEP